MIFNINIENFNFVKKIRLKYIQNNISKILQKKIIIEIIIIEQMYIIIIYR